ncbi:TIGR02556 family CRISPR-associated protein [Caldicoprobacter faecalis]|uniref:CRISPR-associated protein, Csh1 family n=1 Tax=Caldicoprobacter faecalis TaxID=937334 RepID=A0A1I5SZY3_9FIRM|nr:TIGR02556 family CRISPR-associated protein [Caldicoprobacter faecalis]PZN10995.1 MAG: TIGR02556 family CRISPR-associated protein [Caldicoprobacter oshimai]SFP76364.1 CRISPR-associated protein, Csh1 family [Caldicoprobacter faecalis]
MLAAVKEIGRLRIEQRGLSHLEVLVEDPNSTGNYGKVIAIVLEEVNDDEWNFKGIELEDYDETKIMKYLYRSGAANGADLTPTAKLSGKPEGTFDRKILGWFNILDERGLQISQQDKVFLSQVRKQLDLNANYIKKEILRIRDETPNKIGILVTLKFRQNDQVRYVGDFPIFTTLLMYQVDKKNEKCAAKDKVCSICGAKKDLVIGNLDTYAFYTLDKIGYITGGFRENDAWKNFPVCRECKLALDEGKKYIEKHLTFRFCGIEYNLIPKFIVGAEMIPDEILDIFANTSKLVSLKQEVIDRITTDEDDILYYLKDIKDVIALNFLFLKKINAAERILLLIEDVFPSRLRRIFDAKYKTDEIFASKFTFGSIRSFFSKSDPNKRDYDLDGYFLDVVDRVFKDRPVSYHFLLQFIMKKVRHEFVNDGYFYQAVRDGLMTIYFLQKLGLIEMEEEVMEERVFDGLFKKYGPAFETPLKRGLFLLGALTELLLRKQYKERGAKPFMKNLKSLKMNESDFKGLLPKVQNKLEEYNAFDKGKRILAREAANYILLAQDKWQMPVDELNFYFAAGMNMVDEVAKIIYPDEKPEEIQIQE